MCPFSSVNHPCTDVYILVWASGTKSHDWNLLFLSHNFISTSSFLLCFCSKISASGWRRENSFWSAGPIVYWSALNVAQLRFVCCSYMALVQRFPGNSALSSVQVWYLSTLPFLLPLPDQAVWSCSHFRLFSHCACLSSLLPLPSANRSSIIFSKLLLIFHGESVKYARF